MMLKDQKEVNQTAQIGVCCAHEKKLVMIQVSQAKKTTNRINNIKIKGEPKSTTVECKIKFSVFYQASHLCTNLEAYIRKTFY